MTPHAQSILLLALICALIVSPSVWAFWPRKSALQDARGVILM